ncbi:hypothetical protein D3M70_06870 [Pseudomonas sp. LS-2]|nr:hypothetical protein D3M70_06870 [Pseudomonas sp. LS-2]
MVQRFLCPQVVFKMAVVPLTLLSASAFASSDPAAFESPFEMVFSNLEDVMKWCGPVLGLAIAMRGVLYIFNWGNGSRESYIPPAQHLEAPQEIPTLELSDARQLPPMEQRAVAPEKALDLTPPSGGGRKLHLD